MIWSEERGMYIARTALQQ